MLPFTALYPWVFALIPLALGALIWVYRTQGSGERLVYGSLLLLKEIKEKQFLKQKFFPPLRFFIELLIFLILILLLSGFIWRGQEERVAIIVDNSESMGALFEDLTSRRLESGVKYIESWLELQPLTVKIDLYQSSPSLKKISVANSSKGAVLSRASEIVTVSSEDNLRSAIREVALSSSYSEILVVTDKVITIDSEEGGQQIEVFTIPQSKVDNVALVNATVIEKGRGQKGSLQVEVRSFSSRDKEVELQLKKGELSNENLELLPARRTKFVLPSNTTQLVEFKNITIETLYTAELIVGGDALSEDNTYSVYSGDGELSLIVDSPLETEQLNMPVLREFSVRRYEKESEAQYSTLVLSHRGEIDKSYNSSALVVAPLGEKKRGGKLVRSNSVHPILNYIDLAQIDFGEVIPIDIPPWAEPLLEVEAGVIAAVGYRDSFPTVILGFELFPLEGSSSPVRTVLFLNLIKWFKGELGKLSPSNTVKQGSFSFFDLKSKEQSKITDLHNVTTRGIAWQGNESEFSLSNFFSAKESDLQSPQKFILRLDSSVVGEESDLQPLLYPLLLLLLLLICTDILLMNLHSRYAH